MIPERENEALMRLHMCAMDMCAVCKYNTDEAKKCRARISENASILFEALDTKAESDIIKKIMIALGGDAYELTRQGVKQIDVAEAYDRAMYLMERIDAELKGLCICRTCEYCKKHNGQLADYVCSVRGAVVTDLSGRDCDELWKPRKERG